MCKSVVPFAFLSSRFRQSFVAAVRRIFLERIACCNISRCAFPFFVSIFHFLQTHSRRRNASRPLRPTFI